MSARLLMMGCKVYKTTGHVRHATVADILLLMLAEYIVSNLQGIKEFRLACKYIDDPSFIPDLKLQNGDQNSVQKLDQISDATKYRYNV